MGSIASFIVGAVLGRPYGLRSQAAVINPRARSLLGALIGFGPGLAWFAFVAVRYHASPQRTVALALGAVTAVGIMGLCGVFLAWFPYTVERLGFRRFGAWLRRWWDEDAR